LGKDLALAVLDVSETGIRLTVREPLEAGQEGELLLAGRSAKADSSHSTRGVVEY